MTKTSIAIFALLLLTFGFTAAGAQGPSNRTWVSGLGADTGNCPITAPCATFAYAQTQTSVPGEIDVLAPGDFGPVSLTSSLSIVSDGGGTASIGITSGNGITISAGASDSVHLRGLVINGNSSGASGINIVSAGNVAIENCVIRGFSGAGIYMNSNTSGFFSVSNTVASNNNTGISITPTGAATVSGVLDNVATNNNQNAGIAANGALTTGTAVNVTVVNSESSNNTTYGVAASSASGNAPTAITLRNVVANDNGTGLEVQANATIRTSQSVVTGNGIGVTAAGSGILNSYGDNNLDGNTTNNGPMTVIPTR
jgi:hypothetical protein